MRKQWFQRPAPSGSGPYDLQLLYWGDQACPPGHAWGPAVRDHHKLHFVHAGYGMLAAGGRVYRIGPGQAFYAEPHKLLHYEADADEPWTYSWIGFRGSEAEAIVRRTSLRTEPVFAIAGELMPDATARLTAIAQKQRQDGAGELRMLALLYGVLAELVDAHPAAHTEAHADAEGRPASRSDYVNQAVEYLHLHYSEDVSIERLAASLGLDRKYVSALFRQAMGMPPSSYLLQYRMNKASELLREGRLSVAEVARSVGYRDALLFSRMFKKLKGLAPSHYREG